MYEKERFLFGMNHKENKNRGSTEIKVKGQKVSFEMKDKVFKNTKSCLKF